jgi:hypothetical protein
MTEFYYLHGRKYYDPLLNHSKFYIVFSLYCIISFYWFSDIEDGSRSKKPEKLDNDFFIRLQTSVGVGIRNCTKPMLVIRVVLRVHNHGSHNNQRNGSDTEPQFSKKLGNQVFTYKIASCFLKAVSFYQFFHDNHQFFEGFEVLKIVSSDFFFPRNWNRWLLTKLNSHPTLFQRSHNIFFF